MGVKVPPGQPTPYRDIAEVPASLKEFIVTGDGPAEPSGPPGLMFEQGKVYSINAEGAILTRAGRREAAKLAAGHAAQERAEAEAEFANQLPEETRAALEDAHAKNIGLQKAQAECLGRLADAAYEAAQPRPPRQIYVKRGGEWGKVQRATLKPGELLFARTPAGEYEAVGHTNSNAEIPDAVTYAIQT